jgi:hypothetical protein
MPTSTTRRTSVLRARARSEARMRRPDLVADCASCAAVCCVATSFDASEDFAFDKAAGEACRHLTPELRCAIHEALAERGCRGCAAYECYGAGPRVTRLFAGTRGAERLRDEAFRVLRALHEQLWLLTEAAKLCPPAHSELAAAIATEVAALDALAAGPAAALVRVDPEPHAAHARALLLRVGEALGGRPTPARSPAPPPPTEEP